MIDDYIVVYKIHLYTFTYGEHITPTLITSNNLSLNNKIRPRGACKL